MSRPQADKHWKHWFIVDLYHYTSLRNFYSIQGGVSKTWSGLHPRRAFLPADPYEKTLPAKVNNPALFGLLSPLDRAWQRNRYLADEPILETVLKGIRADDQNRVCLVRAAVLPTDDVYVVDHSLLLRSELRNDVVRPYLRLVGFRPPLAIPEVRKAYWESLIPLADYAQSGIKYLVPEVVSFSPIPLERVFLVDVFDRDKLINNIRKSGGFALRPVSPRPEPPQPTPEPPKRPSHLQLVL